MDVIDKLGNPDALTVKRLIAAATGDIADWLMERRNRRALPHRLEHCGYASVKNPDNKQGLWKLKDGQQNIYAKASLSPAEAIKIARGLT